MLYGAENFEYFGDESRPYSAGSQDHCGLMFPGVNKLCYEGGLHWPRRIVHLNDPSDSTLSSYGLLLLLFHCAIAGATP